ALPPAGLPSAGDRADRRLGRDPVAAGDRRARGGPAGGRTGRRRRPGRRRAGGRRASQLRPPAPGAAAAAAGVERLRRPVHRGRRRRRRRARRALARPGHPRAGRFLLAAGRPRRAQPVQHARDDAPVRRRPHAEHFAALAAGSEHGLAGPDAAAWAGRLEGAVADLDVALQWAAGGDIDLGLRMSAALWRWWLTSGQLAAGRGWLGRFLARAAQRRDEESGRAFCSAAVLAAENGDYPEAVRLAKIALGIFDTLGLPERSALAATVLGSAFRYLGDRDAAGRCFQAALDLRAKLDDRRGLSVALNNLALMALDEGDL